MRALLAAVFNAAGLGLAITRPILWTYRCGSGVLVFREIGYSMLRF